MPGEFLHAPGAKLVPQLSADLVALMQGCLKGERSRQSEAAALPGSQAFWEVEFGFLAAFVGQSC